MIRITSLFIFLFTFSSLCFGQDVLDAPTASEWISLINSLGGLAGASYVAIAMFSVQLIMFLIRNKMAEFLGRAKLLVFYALNTAAVVLGLILADVDWSMALVHANTFAALQVFAHQVVKHFKE